MSTPIHAIRALRWNYRWWGVWVFLRAYMRIPGTSIEGRGWWLVLRHPKAVVGMQTGLAEGVIW